MHILCIYGPGLQAPPPTPPQRVWVHRFLYVGGTSGLSPRPPLWVGGACLYVHACMDVCMYLYVSMYVCMYSMPRPPCGWVGACLYVHACIGVCMYLSVSMYVCMYSLCVCMYTCNACCEASTQTNLLLLSLPPGWTQPIRGGGGPRNRKPGSYINAYVYYANREIVGKSYT